MKAQGISLFHSISKKLHSVWKRKKYRRPIIWFVVFTVLVAIFSYLTNPFVRFSLVRDPYKRIETIGDQFILEDDKQLILRDNAFFRQLAKLKSGWHIVGNRFSRDKKSKSATVDDIIVELHELRFNPEEPYLISGDHFSVLYPRSLGIFYHSLLDPRTALDQRDWERRQLIYLKTLAYVLNAYRGADRLSTTIVPVSPEAVALLNVYAYPSDTLYSMLYALNVLKSEDLLTHTYPFQPTGDQPTFSLQTQKEAEGLLEKNKEELHRHYQNYRNTVFDESTGLVKKNLLLSGTKDIAKRSGAFYDNVIFWRTTQLAQELGVVEKDEQFLADLKQRILTTYWLDKEGYFLEDLSTKGMNDKYYSSDWLIVLMTGFLDPTKNEERPYFIRSLEYIQRNAIDQPFGLQYSPQRRDEQPYFWVKWFAPDYGSTAIWSHWGMEYIKLLCILADQTGDEIYLQQAEQQLTAYTYNIKRYRGYPEVYTKEGDFFQQRSYRSVLQTGWVVNFEQARAMFESVREEMGKSR